MAFKLYCNISVSGSNSNIVHDLLRKAMVHCGSLWCFLDSSMVETEPKDLPVGHGTKR